MSCSSASTVLVITGFGLRYPDSWWSYLLLGISENTRGIVHRIAGVVLIVVGFYHAGYAVFTREGQRHVTPDLVSLERCF